MIDISIHLNSYAHSQLRINTPHHHSVLNPFNRSTQWTQSLDWPRQNLSKLEVSTQFFLPDTEIRNYLANKNRFSC